MHVYDVRRVLEVDAARQGARAISAADAETMRRHDERILTAVSDGDLGGALDAVRVRPDVSVRVRPHVSVVTGGFLLVS